MGISRTSLTIRGIQGMGRTVGLSAAGAQWESPQSPDGKDCGTAVLWGGPAGIPKTPLCPWDSEVGNLWDSQRTTIPGTRGKFG